MHQNFDRAHHRSEALQTQLDTFRELMKVQAQQIETSVTESIRLKQSLARESEMIYAKIEDNREAGQRSFND